MTLFEINILNKEIKAEKKLAATEKDLYLYKGMRVSYRIATKTSIEFPKAVGVATATCQVLEGKHGGLVKELGDKKLEKKNYFRAEFQIVTTAIKYCPDSVPKDVTK